MQPDQLTAYFSFLRNTSITIDGKTITLSNEDGISSIEILDETRVRITDIKNYRGKPGGNKVIDWID